jgi:hypothetical protein
MFNTNFDEIIEIFTRNKVDFIIVGGYAINFYGYVRNTSDLDLWVKSSEENKNKICHSISELRYSEKNIEKIKQIDFSKPFLFKIGKELDEVEVFNHITGVNYEEASKNKILFYLNNETPIYFISIKDLIVNKMLTGRTKDKLDVEELQKINLLSKDKTLVKLIKDLFKNKQ